MIARPHGTRRLRSGTDGTGSVVANPKLERLMNLTAALLDTRVPLTAEALRERVGGYPDDRVAFRRAFERDKDDLREMGIPIRIEEIPDSLPRADGYLIRNDEYYLRDPGLTADELAALHLATAAVRIDGVQGLGGLWKLGGTPGGLAGAAPGPSDVSSELAADPNVVTLFGAMADRRVVTFRYHDSEREVEPHRLEFQRGRWYLAGFDRSRDDRRVFRLGRIEGDVVPSGEAGAFTRPAGTPALQLEPWLVGGGEELLARVRIDAAVAAAAVHELGPDTVEERQDDGSVVVAIPVTNRDAFRTFVLGLLEHAEVLSPPELRDDVVSWLRALAGESA